VKTKAEKALEACKEYDRLMKEIDKNRQAIGSAPECDRYVDSESGPYIPDHGMTHLNEVFAGYDTDDGYFAPLHCHYQGDEVLEIIGECEGCKKSYEAIQERKANRKKLAAVKRSIRAIARSA
jgi:Fe-S cluster biogenesis protein NfuA